MNPLKKLASQTAVYGLGTIVPRLLNILLVPFYTRIFIDNQYGIITELYAYMAFLLVVLTYGMETAFFRYAEKEQQPLKVFSTTFLSIATTASIFVFFVILFLDPLAAMIKYSDHQNYVMIFTIIVALDAVAAIPFAYLRQQNKPLRFSIVKIINVCVNIGLNLFWLWLCPMVLASHPDSFLQQLYDPSVGVGYVFISNLVASIVTLLLLSPEIIKIHFGIDKALLRRMLSYALPLLVVGMAGMINEVADKIIFKYLLIVPEGVLDPAVYTMGQLGIYGANYKLAVLMTLFIQMFRYAAEPFFFAQAKEENAKQVYADVMKYFIVFGLTIFLGVSMYIDLFKYFIGPDYWEGLYIVPIILLANLFLGIFYNLSVWYKLTDLTRYAALIAIAGAILTIILNIILVPEHSYYGAAWAHFSCYLFMMIASYFWGKKHYRIDYPLGRILIYAALAMGIYFIHPLLSTSMVLINYGISALLIGTFLLIVFLAERNDLKQYN